MNKKIYSLHRERRLAGARTGTHEGSLDFMCDCGEPVSPMEFAGYDEGGIRLTAHCRVCGQRYDFRLRVDFPANRIQPGDNEMKGYKIFYSLRLKDI